MQGSLARPASDALVERFGSRMGRPAQPVRGVGSVMSAPNSTRASLIVSIILLSSFLGPANITIKIGANLNTLKATLFSLFVVSAVMLCRRIARGHYVFVLSDLLVLCLIFWMEFALWFTMGAAGLTSSVALRPLEFLSAYLIGRCFFGDSRRLAVFARVLVAVVAIMLIFGLADFAAGKNIFSHTFSSADVNQNVPTNTGGTQFRFGLPRARGPLEHAILYGLFFSVSATIIFFSLEPIRLKLIGIALCVAGTLAALSSAPMLNLSILIVFVAYDWTFSNLRWRWAALAGFLFYGFGAIIIFCEHPILQLIKVFTLDPQTGIYRLLIWEWVAYNLKPSPLFGIGTSDWVRLQSMVPSIDALWLNQALQAGYGGLALLIVTILSAFFVIRRGVFRTFDNPQEDFARKGITIAIFQMSFLAFTVHFWGSAWALYALLIGIRAGLSEQRYLPEARRIRSERASRRTVFPIPHIPIATQPS